MKQRQFIIDVSFYQGDIDWHTVASATRIDWPGGFAEGPGVVAGAIIKATGEETQGDKPFRDSKFIANWEGINKTMLRRGPYHFMDGGVGSATGKTEAIFFASVVDIHRGLQDNYDFVPWVDVEWPPKGGQDFDIDQLAEFLWEAEERMGSVVGVYTGRWYWPNIKDEELRVWCGTGRPLWLASYPDTINLATPPKPPAPWKEIDIWQFTDKARVPGIKGGVDLNVLLTDYNQVTL